MAPLRETALGLKFDSTLIKARTRLGSTLWRSAARFTAASISAGVKFALRWLANEALENEAEVRIVTELLPEFLLRYSFTSATAERAARTWAAGTGFQRFSVTLQ